MKLTTPTVPLSAAGLTRGTGRALVRFGLVLVAAVALFSGGFLLVMVLAEDREHTWAEAVYWTLVTMSTLGYGDIVFESDVGRVYSVAVLLVGALLVLILLPFTFIQVVYLPWRAALRAARIPRTVPAGVTGHVLLTGDGPIERVLRHRAESSGVPVVDLLEDPDRAVALHDEGRTVLVGDVDDPATHRAARVDEAKMVLLADSDQRNTNVAFTVREVSDAPVVVATATSKDSIDVLELAGADRVLHLGETLGHAFARRILAPSAACSVIARFGDLAIAEASAAGTELVGRTLDDLDLHERFGVRVVGLWDRGSLVRGQSDARVEESSVLLLAGTDSALEAYNGALAPRSPDGSRPEDGERGAAELVLVLGGGRVGRAAARALEEAGTRCRIVERDPGRVRGFPTAVVGDAADLEVLRRAGIDEASAVVVTTHDDDTNVYLTLYCRRLRPDVEILGRVAVARNVTTMHRAGADFVLSYASVGAIEAWNAMREHPTRLLAEGLVAFRVPVPAGLGGRPLAASGIPRTGCEVVGVIDAGDFVTDVDGTTVLPAGGDLVLVSDLESEERFLARYSGDRGGRQGRGRLALTRSRARRGSPTRGSPRSRRSAR